MEDPKENIPLLEPPSALYDQAAELSDIDECDEEPPAMCEAPPNEPKPIPAKRTVSSLKSKKLELNYYIPPSIRVCLKFISSSFYSPF